MQGRLRAPQPASRFDSVCPGICLFFSQISHQHGDSRSCDIKARVSCFCKCHKSGGWGHRATIGGNRKQLPEQTQNRLPRSRRGPQAPGRSLTGAAWPWTHRHLRPLSQSTPLIHHLVREKLRPQEAACPGLHGQLAAEQGYRARGLLPTGTPLLRTLCFQEHDTISELEKALRTWSGDSQVPFTSLRITLTLAGAWRSNL